MQIAIANMNLLSGVKIRRRDAHGNFQLFHIGGQARRQKNVKHLFDIELADTQTALEQFDPTGRTGLPHALCDFRTAIENRRHIFVYLVAGHATRHSCPDDRAYRRTRNGDRLDTQFIEHLDNMEMGNTPRPATAESDGNSGR